MPNGDGGVQIARRWSYASNCQQAAVLAAGVVRCDAGGPIVGGVAVGTSDRAASRHIMFSHHLQTGLGRELAGLPTAAFLFLPGVDP